MRQWLSEEEIGHEDLVLVAAGCIGMGEDISALDCLVGEAEDVVDYEDCACGGRGPRGVALHAIEVEVFAFGRVAFGDGWGDVAARLDDVN